MLHVQSGAPEEETRTEAYWKMEAAKVGATRDVRIGVNCVANEGNDVVDTILSHSIGADVVVLGSLELIKAKGKVALGSVAQAVAKRSGAHVCIVKNFSAI